MKKGLFCALIKHGTGPGIVCLDYWQASRKAGLFFYLPLLSCSSASTRALTAEGNRSQQAMNMAAISGPITKPFRPKNRQAAQGGDQDHVVRDLGVFTHQQGAQQVVYQADYQKIPKAVRMMPGT